MDKRPIEPGSSGKVSLRETKDWDPYAVWLKTMRKQEAATDQPAAAIVPDAESDPYQVWKSLIRGNS